MGFGYTGTSHFRLFWFEKLAWIELLGRVAENWHTNHNINQCGNEMRKKSIVPPIVRIACHSKLFSIKERVTGGKKLPEIGCVWRLPIPGFNEVEKKVRRVPHWRPIDTREIAHTAILSSIHFKPITQFVQLRWCQTIQSEDFGSCVNVIVGNKQSSCVTTYSEVYFGKLGFTYRWERHRRPLIHNSANLSWHQRRLLG